MTLLGIPGDNTYSNYQEAQRAFWRSTVLPLVVRTAKALSSWLAPAWEVLPEAGNGQARGSKPGVYPVRGESRLELRPDLDQIEALTSEREALWARIEKVSFLTLNEKRQAVGYAPLEEVEPDGDVPGATEKYNPNQPRAPRGTSEGGQWVDDGGGSGGGDSDPSSDERIRVAQASSEQDKYRVDLRIHDEELGGHTLRDHVNKSDEDLLEIVRRDRYDGFTFSIARIQQGSFLSEGDANYFVNETLSANRHLVDEVASGARQYASLNRRFGSVTGKEAFRVDVKSDPVMRPTYAVRVIIEHDIKSPAKFRVKTAFPRNQLPGE